MSYKFTTIPKKTLYQSILSTSTTFKMSDIKGFDGADLTSADFGTVAYGVLLNSEKTVMELFSFDPATIASTSISFIYRGLKFDGDLTTEVAANKLDWTSDSTILIGTDTPQVLQWLKEYIDGIAVSGSPDMDTTTKGIAEEATQAEVDAGTATGGTSARLAVNPSTIRAKAYHDYVADSVGTDSYAITVSPAITAYVAGQEFTFKAATANTGACTLNVCGLGTKDIKKDVSVDLATGDILANQIVKVIYDGTNMQMVSSRIPLVPVVRTYTYTSVGSSTSQFDITNPAGTTFRYTYDGTGTNPSISDATFPIGTQVNIKSTSMNAANTGYFVVTASGTNYFEVTNAAGVVESNKTINEFLKKNSNITWTKPSGLKYITVEVQAGGGGGGGATTSSDFSGSGGGAGGYSRKLIVTASLGATEAITVGAGGISGNTGSSPTAGTAGGPSSFGAHATANGGAGGLTRIHLSLGGTAASGDINIQGGSSGGMNGTAMDNFTKGGESQLGRGGNCIPGTGDVASGERTGYGAGAFGNYTKNGTSFYEDHGNGDGIIIVTEYY
jgi:hypothetical protein